MSETETQWHVQVEEGLVKLWSLDQLDAAFKAGLIDERTFVLEDGATEWMTLGALLGSDEEEAAPPAPAAAPSYAASPSVMPQSLRPITFSPESAPLALDLDDDMPASFRSSKKKGIVIGLSLAAVAAAVAVAAFRFGGGAPADPPPVAAAAPVAPVVAAAPAVEETKDAGTSDTAPRLTDDQRRALAQADKAMAAKHDALQKTRAASAPRHHKSMHEKAPFQNGGAQGDPLNAKL